MTDYYIEHYNFPQNLSSTPPLRTHFIIDELDDVGSHDYRFESNRLQTFKDWLCPWMKPERLAVAGFYYTGEIDQVKCFECSIEICQWQADDNPMVCHQRWSDKCRFIRNIPCGNVPIGADPNKIPTPSPKSKDICGPYGMVYMPLSGPDNNFDIEETKFNLRGIGAARPKYPEYASYNARLRTFESWPISMRQKKEDLAEAGFFYTGRSDQTLCHYCGGGLNNWEPDDDPWQEHAKHLGRCLYLLKMKGREFVNKITGKAYYKDIFEPSSAGESNETQMEDESLATANSVNSIASEDTSIKSTESSAGSSEGSISEENVKIQFDKSGVNDARMCQICYSRELRKVFLPCGHFLSCEECAKDIKICGLCHKPVTNIIQAYLS